MKSNAEIAALVESLRCDAVDEKPVHVDWSALRSQRQPPWHRQSRPKPGCEKQHTVSTGGHKPAGAQSNQGTQNEKLLDETVLEEGGSSA